MIQNPNTNRSSHTNASGLGTKSQLGQENRRPLMHRAFPSNKLGSSTQQSSSVGAVKRGVTGSFLSGGSNQLLQEIITTPQQAAIFANSQHYKKERQINRMPNQSITSAAPASQPPLQLEQKLLDTSTLTS